MTSNDPHTQGQSAPPLSVRINGQRCEGHAVCFLVAPELFGVDDDGRGIVIEPLVGGEHLEIARTAMDRCPENAISVTSDRGISK